MKPRNKALHADIDRYVDLKMQMEKPKNIANRHHTSPETVRVLISREMKARKLMNVKIHVEQSDAKIAHRPE